MNGKLVVAALLGAVLLAGCAQKGPKVMPDGFGTRVLSSESYLQSHYAGQWRDGRPKGLGQVRSTLNGTLTTCSGEFGVEPPAGISGDTSLMTYGRGDVHINGVHMFSGLFENMFSVPGALCIVRDGTAYSSFGGQKIVGRFAGQTGLLKAGPCEVQRPNGEALIGDCSATHPEQLLKLPAVGGEVPRIIDVTKFRETDGTDYFRLVSGPGTYIDAAGTRYEGEINRSGVLTGLYKMTRKGEQAATRAQLVSGKIIAEFPLAETVVAQGKACGSTPWLLMKGDCASGSWSGAVDAYTADGMTRLTATFANGIATSEATIVSLEDGRTVRGQLPAPFRGEVAFTRGQLLVGGVVEYDGEMQGLKPHGKGICTFEGAPEVCEYLAGQRIDALYKIRQETRRAAATAAPTANENAAVPAAAPAANYTATGQPAAPATAGSTAGAIAAECAKKFVAMKACDRMPGLGANLCRAAANKKFSHLVCSVIQ